MMLTILFADNMSILNNRVFTLYIYCIGTMPRFVRAKTWFFRIILCIPSEDEKSIFSKYIMTFNDVKID